MNLRDFDYHLPEDRIAQAPISPREEAKLMVVSKQSTNLSHRQIKDLPLLLKSDDVLVLNNTKVFRARLNATIIRPSIPDRWAELFLVRPHERGWIAIGKPGKVFSPSTLIQVHDDFRGRVVDTHEDGTFVVDFGEPPEAVISKANSYGSVPIPPYISTIADPNDYQTSYAKVTGSVAAPTAGFHLTTELLATIRKKGITVVEITLHVGLGTFLPIKTDTLEEHTMHSEWVDISADAAKQINKAKEQGSRIIAIGTTTTRALEGAGFPLKAFTGDVNLFITPGFHFQVIDGLLTNFHLPKSTLLLLVSALAGKETIQSAYQTAITHNYRFYSFGDAMLIT